MRKRSGMLVMLVGVALALVSGLMVLAIARRASAAQPVVEVKQVLVVMAAREVPEGTAISADALVMQAFPADFIPLGAIPTPEQAVGKYTTTRLTKGQIVLDNQLSPTKRAGNVARSVPPGKVAVALPMTDLMSTAKAINPGDHVDVLLTLNLREGLVNDPQSAPAGAGKTSSGMATGARVVFANQADTPRNNVTQATLQNVEVLQVGEAEESTANIPEGNAVGARKVGSIIVLVDHQDALVLKYAKDSGGVVDLALRAPEDTAHAKTEPMTVDLLFERFQFRRPVPVP